MKEFESMEEMKGYVKKRIANYSEGELRNLITQSHEFGETKGYEDGNIEDGPFCTKCFDRDGKKCRLVIHHDNINVKCLNCILIKKIKFSYYKCLE